MTANRVRRIAEGCHFQAWADVSGNKVDSYVKELRNELSAQTACHYARAFRQFCNWMLRHGRTSSIPAVRGVKVPKRPERAFELDEFRRLLEAVMSGPVRYGMSGYERYLCYLVAVETGLGGISRPCGAYQALAGTIC